MPQQTPEQWADKQIFSKTEIRINQLENNEWLLGQQKMAL